MAAEPGALSGYAWNGRTLTFFHCSTCGCLTHYESNERAEGERTIAVNARMFAAETIAGIRVRTFDGADTWKYVDEPAGAWKLPGPPARPAPAGRRSRR